MPTTGFEVRGSIVRQRSPEFAGVAVNVAVKVPALSSGDLGPGEKARGFITYEVPKTSTGLSLKLTLGDDTMMVSLD
jgi:hypothetical protein